MKSMGLSTREKRLLILLLVLGVSFLSFRFLIQPLYNYTGTLEETLNTAVMDQMTTKGVLIGEGMTRQNLESAKVQMEELRGRYPAEMPNEDINDLVTDLYIRNGLTSTNMNLSTNRTQPEDVTSYVTTGVTVTLTGTYGALKRMIDEVESTDYIRIGRLSFATESLGDAETGENTVLQNIAVYFEITMLI